MKKNLQLSVLALALCCVTVNAQNVKTVGSQQPLLSNITKNNPNQSSHKDHIDQQAPQGRCGTNIPHGEWESWSAEKLEQVEKENRELVYPNGAKTSAVYTIPVIFHIIHGGTAVGTGINISQAQINDQITIMNNDFKSAGLNSGLCPAWALPLKADAQISFCLATKSPTGGILAEPGIDRRSYTTVPGLAAPGAGYSMGTCDATMKPPTIWNPTYYFNVWVTALSGGLLGYSTFPVGTTITGITGNGSASTDGVVCGSQYIGSIGSATTAAPYNKGRTLVHESGHWLGLRHINGDANCATDYTNDTPTQDALHGGCIPSTPGYHVNLCGAGSSPNGEMTMNYMDYTDDACMYMWSVDQKTRMQQAMLQGTYRSQLSTSAATLCVLSPQAPVSSFSCASSACSGVAVTMTNTSTGIPTPTYSWSTVPSAGVTYNPSNTATSPLISFASVGPYTITCKATNSVNTNSSTRAITISTCAAVCKDTITNCQTTATLNLAIAGTDTTTPGCSPKAGYIFGSNCYDDLEKAEFFAQSMYATIATPKITSVIVLFYKNGSQGTGGAAGTAVNLKLYTGDMAGGPTGTATPIATATSNIGAILATAATNSVAYVGAQPVVYPSNLIIPYKYNFPSNPSAPAVNGFFASVTLPTASGDTAVVLSDNTLATGTNWELWSPSGWFNVSPTWGGFDASMAILPIISCSATAVNDQNTFASNINLMPNPTTGLFNIVTTLPGGKDISLTVTNAMGQLITKAELVNASNGFYTVDLSSYNNGVYFITLQSDNDKVVKRVILSK